MAHRNTGHPNSSSPSSAVLPAAVKEPIAAPYIGYSRAYLKKARRTGTGPDYIRCGRSILYRLADLDRWLENHVVRTGA
jgi:hypothetical protein